MITRSQSHFELDAAFCSLLEGQTLNKKSARHVFDSLFQSSIAHSQIRAILILLANRGESVDELIAAWNAIRQAEQNSIRRVPYTLDTCGTGGDGSHSINLSTLSAIVMAAAGLRVLKHGNRAITSHCGSSDLLASFGFNLAQSPSRVIQTSQKTGFGYFHAPHVHPIYSKFQTLRRTIQTRTLFNLLGPVLNPVAVDYQILGLASEKFLPLYAKILPRIGRKSSLIFVGAQGMDELTTLGPSTGLQLEGKRSKKWTLKPHQLGFKKGRLSELQIQSVAHAKKKTIEILKQKKNSTAYDCVVLSAACGIMVAQKVSIQEGAACAEKAIQSGRAWALLQQAVRLSKL